jgi:hypothetical protein
MANKQRRPCYDFHVGKSCRVSFEDSEGIKHSVMVQADSLFEAAGIALARFRGAELVVGAAVTFEVAVSEPIITHAIRLARLRDWLGSSGRTPKEQATKTRLREMLQD